MSQHRRHRGYETQRIVAEYLSDYWPHAVPVGAGRQGSDITGVPFDIEVKARRGFPVIETMNQLAARSTPSQLSFAVLRPDGYGGARVAQWPAIFTLADAVRLIKHLEVPNENA